MKRRLDEALKVVRMSGLRGLGRTLARTALVQVRDRANTLQTELLHSEARARVPKDQRELVRRNEKYRGMHAGQRCFVLGTGPSLANYDLSRLSSEVVFGVNGLIRHAGISTFPPTYYALMDWGFFDEPESAKPFFDLLREKTPGCTYFVPSQFHSDIAKHGWLPSERTRYIAMDGSFADAVPAPIDLATFLPGTPNAVQFALAAALFLGFSDIYVLGADHDWLTKRYPGHPDWDEHCYDGYAIDRRGTPNWDPFETYLGGMVHCEMLWRCYQNLRKVAAIRGQVIHMHSESYIDVFPRFDYDRVLGTGEVRLEAR
jgi:hypothetical protein